jgi:hypothetical protein
VALDREQRIVLAGMAGAALFSLAFVLALAPLVPPPAIADTAADRLAFALRCEVFAALALLAGVARIAAQRFFAREIDGTQPPRARSLEVNRAYLQNTGEQLALAFFAHAGFALSAPLAELRALPVLVALFLLGRATFWAGYRRSPPARAFGFAATFYPTAVVLVWSAWRIGVGAAD